MSAILSNSLGASRMPDFRQPAVTLIDSWVSVRWLANGTHPMRVTSKHTRVGGRV